jgi:hypothetical protein
MRARAYLANRLLTVEEVEEVVEVVEVVEEAEEVEEEVVEEVEEVEEVVVEKGKWPMPRCRGSLLPQSQPLCRRPVCPKNDFAFAWELYPDLHGSCLMRD